jgi:molecular chaperone HscB
MSKCWSCGADRAASDPLCAACGKVQPPSAAPDKFAVLGLDRSYEIDLAQVEERYRALSRKLHPDRFARASPRDRRFSLEQTTLLNDAWRTLKDPARRAEHLLALRGVKVASDVKMSPEFLEQTMEDREKLMDAKLSGEPLSALAQGVREKRDAAMAEVRTLLQGEVDPARAADLLARMRYYERYLDEVEGREAEI